MNDIKDKMIDDRRPSRRGFPVRAMFST